MATRVSGATDKLNFDDTAGTEQLLEALFQVALNRTPTAQELPLSIEFLVRHARQHQVAGDRASLLALTDLCRAILNLNEFAYID